MANDVRVLLRIARRQRFHVEHRKNGHYRVTAPDGRWTTVPCTPRGSKGRERSLARLRRIGVQL